MAAVTSRLERNTQVTTPEEWDKRRPRLEDVVKPLLEKQPGFDGLDLEWSNGRLVETTRWSSEQACRDYIRNGGAATVATFADQVVPTAAYPNGTWVRTNSF
ncbi:MAG TPA: hypothetical protein VFZ12_04515 [Dehalococcoidia bacterium]|nr:hypothetical protein [Dehalococcoidia bacterium]